MKVTIQVVIERDDEPPIVDEIACLERAMLTPDTLGLTLAEAKTVLAQLQNTLVKEQAATYVAQEQICPHCGAPRSCKGHHQIVVRSLFGKLTLSSPRLYTCTCQADDSRQSSSPLADLLPERTTPRVAVSRSQMGCAPAVWGDRGCVGRDAPTARESHHGVSAPAAGCTTVGR